MCEGGESGDGVSVTWVDDVTCEGGEERLADCRHAGWGVHNCLPSENIAIRCIGKTTINICR